MFPIKTQIQTDFNRRNTKTASVNDIKECVKMVCESSTDSELEENEEESLGEEDGTDEDVETGGVEEVLIEGDGDCFYSAIVEAFNRQGIDITTLLEAEVQISIRV